MKRFSVGRFRVDEEVTFNGFWILRDMKRNVRDEMEEYMASVKPMELPNIQRREQISESCSLS